MDRDGLRRAIEGFAPHVFHFIGHGDRRGAVGGLLIERADRHSEFLPAELLLELLRRPGTVRVAVVNACLSDGAAYALAQQGMAAVGMQYEVRNEPARHFCRSLYESLVSGVPLDEAANAARFAVMLECGVDRRDWCVPVAFLPGGAAPTFAFERAVTVVQVKSVPPGAEILLDGRPTGKATPEAVVIEGRTAHRISVTIAGYEPSSAHAVGGPRGAESTVLEFSLARQMGTLVVQVGRANVPVALVSPDGRQRHAIGQTKSDGALGPVELPAGEYTVEAQLSAGTATGHPLAARARHVAVK